jgi:hypothetical protein
LGLRGTRIQEWRKLHNDYFHDLEVFLKYSGIKFKKTEMDGLVARVEERRFAYVVLVGQPEVQRPLGRTSSRWEDNMQDSQCTYNVILGRVCITIVAVEKQQLLHILSVCL